MLSKSRFKIMHPIVKRLQELIAQKREAIDQLHAFYHLQVELDYDTALLRLELRDDIDLDIDLIEVQLQLYYENLREYDDLIAETLVQIDYLSFEISNI